jgi:hypothetical protein
VDLFGEKIGRSLEGEANGNPCPGCRLVTIERIRGLLIMVEEDLGGEHLPDCATLRSARVQMAPLCNDRGKGKRWRELK